MKKLKKVTIVAILLIMSLVFFVTSLLIIQRYGNFTKPNQIYGISLANAMFGAIVGACINSIIYYLKDKKTLFMILPAIMTIISAIFFALVLATLNTNNQYFYIGVILLFVTMFACVLVQVISIIQAIRGKMEISEKSEQ